MQPQLDISEIHQLHCQDRTMHRIDASRPGINFGMQCLVARGSARQKPSIRRLNGMPHANCSSTTPTDQVHKQTRGSCGSACWAQIFLLTSAGYLRQRAARDWIKSKRSVNGTSISSQVRPGCHCSQPESLSLYFISASPNG